MPGARAKEAARLISLFLGDLCVVAMAGDELIRSVARTLAGRPGPLVEV